MNPSSPPALPNHLRIAIPILDLPEILQRIFLFIDVYTLRHTLIFVCRSWHRAIQNTLPRTVVWHSSWNKTMTDLVSSRLVGTSRFFCYLWADANRDINNVDIGIVLHQSQVNYYQQAYQRKSQLGTGNQGKGTKLYRFSPLQELYLQIDAMYSSSAINKFPFSYSLTRLVLTVHLATVNAGTGNLCNIFGGCPLLESFEAHGTADLSLTWTPSEANRQMQCFPLRSSIIYNIKLKQDCLEELLAFATGLRCSS
ncbi:MAG: hypothetical protein JOS17DRAFT_756309 [Linnemannia elongata]|nr:MAG: hypothetical protein JOS17DRAFT_756309 [Linnemannia elongata]